MFGSLRKLPNMVKFGMPDGGFEGVTSLTFPMRLASEVTVWRQITASFTN